MDDSIIEEKIGLEKELKLLEESLESEVISEEEYKKRKENIGIRLDHIVKIEKEAKEKPRETEEQEKGQHIKTEEQEKPNKYQLILIPLIIILFTMSLSVYLRIQPAFLPVTDDWATDYVHDSVISQIREKINQQYFDLSETEKNNMIEKEFQRALIQQKSRIEKEIELRSNYYKSHLQNDKGQTYLLASDPYFWMRKVENIIDHGHPGDYIKKKGEPHPVFTLPSLETDQQWNDHMLAPHGRELAHDTFHAYFSAYLYKFLHLFNRNLDLMALFFYIPVILSALCVIPTFFIGKKIIGNFGGFVSAFIIAVHPFFLRRTFGGFSDTDVYTLLFPLLIMWLYFTSLSSKDRIKSIILAVSSGFLVGLFSFTWGGWPFIFDFIIIASIIYLTYYSLCDIQNLRNGFKEYLNKPTIKNTLIILSVFTVSSAVFVTIFREYDTFAQIWRIPLAFITLKDIGGGLVLWPNVFTTVAEQKEIFLSDVVLNIGGKFLFFLSLVGILLLTVNKGTKIKYNIGFIIISTIWLYIISDIIPQNANLFFILLILPIITGMVLFARKSYKKANINIIILLIIWYLATIYASTQGIRWVLLLVPAFSIALGIAFGKIYRYLSTTIVKELNINKVIARGSVIILLCLLLMGPFILAKSDAASTFPEMNDAWWNSLEKIKNESKSNAIISSWWDYGHWFKSIADRAVTFDGTTQNSPSAHWIGKVLLTDDEDIAIGILRMLDCSLNNAFLQLEVITNDQGYSIDILYNIFTKDKNEAKKVLLEYNLTEEQADSILAKTHCSNPPEAYFIVSDDMVSKSGAWGHFGSWDFHKALIYKTLIKKEYRGNLEKSISFMQDRFDYTEEKAESIYHEIQDIHTGSEADSWIAPWPGYRKSPDSCKKTDEFNLICSDNIHVDLKRNEIFILTSNQEKIYPKLFTIPKKDGNLIITEYNESLFRSGNGRPVGAVLIPRGKNYDILLMDYTLTNSMFTRMFYLDGHGLKHFKKFSDERSIFGDRVIIHGVDWGGGEKNILDHFRIPKEEKLEESIEQKRKQ